MAQKYSGWTNQSEKNKLRDKAKRELRIECQHRIFVKVDKEGCVIYAINSPTIVIHVS